MASATEALYTCTLSKELQKKATKELNEKTKHRARDTQFLRERVLANRALTCPTDDYYLLKFLRAAKFDYDKAYERLINYHTIRAKNWDIYMTMVPSHIKDTVLADGVTMVLPSKDKEGRTIMFNRPAKWQYRSYPNCEIHKANIMNLEVILEDEEATVNGIVLFLDLEGLSTGMLPYLERRQSKLTVDIVRNGYPIRIKAIYCINATGVFEIVYQIFKPLLKQKMKDRVHLVKDLDQLQTFIGKSALPEDYGGTLPKSDVLAEQWKKRLLSKEEKFRKLMDHKIVLDRQIGDKQDDNVVSNVVGTFKKLDV